MKLELQRQDFLKAWQIAEKFIDAKSAKESISGIFVRAFEDGRVTLEATDLKTSVRCEAEGVNVIEPGVAVVPAMILGSMIKKSASDDLMLEVNSERGFLSAGKSKTRFAIISAETFPKIPESSGAEKIFDFQGSDFAKMIAEGGSASSMPQDFPKYIGTCLLRAKAGKDDEKGKITIVSTDGKRLSRAESPCESISKETDLLLPAQAFKDLGKTLASNYPDKIVKILADDSTIWFSLEGVEFSIRLIDATFPIYERILNDIVETSLKIKTEDLIPVLDRIDIIARTIPAHIMAMILNPNGELRITARAPERGTASESMNTNIEGKYLQVGFNVGYFLDGLKILGNGEVKIEFSGDESQTRMKRINSDGSDNNDFLYMLMPARLSQQDRIAEQEMGEFESDNNDSVDATDTEVYNAAENKDAEENNQEFQDNQENQ